MSELEFRVLGPVEVIRDGQPVEFGGGTLAKLLAGLLLSVNRVVSGDALTETVWNRRPPVHPRAALHTGIARMRRVLGDDLIETLPYGYRIRTDAGHLDLLRFEQLIAAADQAASAEAAESALAGAVGLWRGPPFENLDSPVLNEAVPRLTRRYLDACERWAELGLQLGRPEAVAARLTTLVDAHPFRERMVGQLILALLRGGRQADALAAYENLRRALGDEMGIDPSATLQELQLKILRADPSLTRDPLGDASEMPSDGMRDGGIHDGALPQQAVPRQLPRDLPDFCGRAAEIAELTGFLDGAGPEPGETPVAAISGKGGVGKTALAVRAGHLLSCAHRDGQLYMDLQGAGPRPAQPEDVLASFLRALGVASAAIPRSLPDRIAMYRSLSASRRLLVVLDNAAGEGQVQPLLPASGTCAVIVTSRSLMSELPGARHVRLDVLADAHAIDLLGRIIGAGRAAAENDEAGTLVALCGGLPLALRIVGARLVSKPHWRLGRLADRLSDTRHRLNELTHGDLDVRATLALSYQALEPRAQVMFRRLGLLAVPDFPAWAAAALLDTSIASAEDFCERLVDAQLLDPVSRHAASGPRYRFHDLVRAYAEELAIATDPPTVRTAALARAFGALMALSEEAHRHVYGGDFTILHGGAPRWTCATEVLRPVIAENPMTWLDGERIAILAAIRQCAELGLDELSWDLAWTAVTLYEARGYFDDWRAAQQFALAASREAGNARGMAAMLLAQASLKLNFNDPSEETLVLSGEALRLFTAAGDTHGCAIAQYQIGIAYTRKGQLNAALDVLEHARDNSRAAGDRFLEAGVLRELANACLAQDDHQASMEYLTQALRIQDEIGSLRGRSMTLYTLGELHLRRHDAAAARSTFTSVLSIVRLTNQLIGEMHALLGLGEALAQDGYADRAEHALQSALRLARATRKRMIEARALLALGDLNAARDRKDEARRQVSRSLAIFRELAAPPWQQRASDALRALDRNQPAVLPAP